MKVASRKLDTFKYKIKHENISKNVRARLLR